MLTRAFFILFIILLNIIIFPNNLLGQNWVEIKPNSCDIPMEDRQVIDIQKITLKDSVIISNVISMIEELNHSDSLFRIGLGYFILRPYRPYMNKDIIQQYYLTYNFYSLKEDDTEYAYPPFYTVIQNKLVFVDPYALKKMTCYRFSEKSKKKLRKVQERFLPKTEDATFYNMDGTVAFRDKNFRIDVIRLHVGKVITIYKNRPPEVLSEKEYEEKYYRRGY